MNLIDFTIKIDDKYSKELKAFESQLSKIEKHISKINNMKVSPKTGGGSSSNNFNGLGMLGGIGGIAVAGTALVSFGKNIVEITSKYENLQRVINFTSGSATAGANVFQMLEKNANSLGLSVEASAEGWKTFSGAFMHTGVTLGKQKTMFTQVSKATATMGLSADETKGVFLAMGQMMSKGKISAEELRGQLGERLPGAMQMMARAAGVSTNKLDEMMRKGLLPSIKYLPLLANEMEKTVGTDFAKNIDTIAGKTAILSNNWSKFLLNIGNSAPIKTGLDLLNKGLDLANKHMFSSTSYEKDYAKYSAGEQNTDNFVNKKGNVEKMFPGKNLNTKAGINDALDLLHKNDEYIKKYLPEREKTLKNLAVVTDFNNKMKNDAKSNSSIKFLTNSKEFKDRVNSNNIAVENEKRAATQFRFDQQRNPYVRTLLEGKLAALENKKEDIVASNKNKEKNKIDGLAGGRPQTITVTFGNLINNYSPKVFNSANESNADLQNNIETVLINTLNNVSSYWGE